MKEWTTPDFRNMPSTTNLEEEEIVEAPGNDGNTSMPEQVKRRNPWRKKMMMIMYRLSNAKEENDLLNFGEIHMKYYINWMSNQVR